MVLLGWGVGQLADALLAGTFLRGAKGDESLSPKGFARWTQELDTRGDDLRTAAELEVKASVRRFLVRAHGSATPNTPPGAATATGVALATRYVARHLTEAFAVADVAASVGWHRAHLMESFKQVCGIPLWEYVTRLRVKEAQRLLTTTDLPVLAVCHRAGFSSTSRMYVAFGRVVGETPAVYRAASRGASVRAVMRPIPPQPREAS